MAYSPLDQGILCDSNYSTQTLQSISYKRNATVSQIILSWIIHKGIIPIFTSQNKNHIKENVLSLDITLNVQEIASIDSLGASIEYVDIDSIIPISGGHYSRHTYSALIDAKENALGYCPSPTSISKYLLSGNSIKPIKVNRMGKNFKLIEGRCRYWGWRIAFGDHSTVPVYIRETVV